MYTLANLRTSKDNYTLEKNVLLSVSQRLINKHKNFKANMNKLKRQIIEKNNEPVLANEEDHIVEPVLANKTEVYGISLVKKRQFRTKIHG